MSCTNSAWTSRCNEAYTCSRSINFATRFLDACRVRLGPHVDATSRDDVLGPSGESNLTDQELRNSLKAFRLHLESQGYKTGDPGPLEHRMDGASRFALFLAGRPVRYGEGPPDDWQGR